MMKIYKLHIKFREVCVYLKLAMTLLNGLKLHRRSVDTDLTARHVILMALISVRRIFNINFIISTSTHRPAFHTCET